MTHAPHLLSRRQALLTAMSLAPARTRAAVAFHYAAVFTPRELAWYTRFDMLVTGAILAPAMSRKLQRSATKLVAYEWISGFYPGDPVSAPPAWHKEVCCQKPSWTLTEGPITGGAAEKGKAAHWYDFGNDALIEARARNLAKRVTDAGYHGLFFDTPGFEHLPPVAQTVFRQRYPRMDYDERQGRFLAALRRALPAGKVLFTNQGYRHADHLLPHADFDLTESTFTGVGERGSTIFRQWHDPARAWESVRTPMYELILPTLRKFPKVRMVHVNYAGTNPADVHRAIQYGYAASLIFGHDSYLMAPAASAAEEDPIYFTDLGPAEDFWKEEPSGAVWRRFRHGIAVLNSATRRVEIPSLNLPTLEPQRGYIFPAKL